jgi:hypothetical protein
MKKTADTMSAPHGTPHAHPQPHVYPPRPAQIEDEAVEGAADQSEHSTACTGCEEVNRTSSYQDALLPTLHTDETPEYDELPPTTKDFLPPPEDRLVESLTAAQLHELRKSSGAVRARFNHISKVRGVVQDACRWSLHCAWVGTRTTTTRSTSPSTNSCPCVASVDSTTVPSHAPVPRSRYTRHARRLHALSQCRLRPN